MSFLPYGPYIIVGIVCLIIGHALQDRRWRCTAPGCDFTTKNEDEAKKHTESHSKHKPVWKTEY